MDVSQEVQQRALTYSSGSTNPASLSPNRSLRFASGPTIDRAVVKRISAIPQTLIFEDTVGLFGSENQYVRFELNTEDIMRGVDVEDQDGYRTVLFQNAEETGDYEPAESDDRVQEDQSVYVKAVFVSQVPDQSTTRLSAKITNLKTGNKYIDNWVDVSLYDKQKNSLEYEKLYITPKGQFTVGIHARKANRLPFRIQVDIGYEILSEFQMTEEQRRYMPG